MNMEDNESEYRVGKRVPNIVPSDGVGRIIFMKYFYIVIIINANESSI